VHISHQNKVSNSIKTSVLEFKFPYTLPKFHRGGAETQSAAENAGILPERSRKAQKDKKGNRDGPMNGGVFASRLDPDTHKAIGMRAAAFASWRKKRGPK
jgi:hypothetical protein